MGFRRDGKSEHKEATDWSTWKQANTSLIGQVGLPPGLLNTRSDWEYFLEHGYWCEAHYGAFVGNVDFRLEERSSEQRLALYQLLRSTHAVIFPVWDILVSKFGDDVE